MVSTRSFFLFFFPYFFWTIVDPFISKNSSFTDFSSCNIFRCTYVDEVISDVQWADVTIGRHCVILYFENVTFVNFNFSNVVFTAQQEVFSSFFSLLEDSDSFLFFSQIIFRDTTFKNSSGLDDATLTLTPHYVPPAQTSFISFDGLSVGK